MTRNRYRNRQADPAERDRVRARAEAKDAQLVEIIAANPGHTWREIEVIARTNGMGGDLKARLLNLSRRNRIHGDGTNLIAGPAPTGATPASVLLAGERADLVRWNREHNARPIRSQTRPTS